MQAGDGARRVIGMDRRKHQMAGHGSFHGDLRGFLITDFSDHDDVRILPQKRAQRRGKIKADFLINVYLDDSGKIVLDRIFGGHDFHVRGIDRIDRGIECGGFSGTRRAADEDQARTGRCRISLSWSSVSGKNPIFFMST